MSIVCHLVSINPRESIAVSGDFCMFTFSGRGLARLCLIADYIYKTWQFVHLSDKRGMSLQASWRVASSSPIILGFEILPIGITATHCGFGINGLFGEQLSLFTLCEASSVCVCVYTARTVFWLFSRRLSLPISWPCLLCISGRSLFQHFFSALPVDKWKKGKILNLVQALKVLSRDWTRVQWTIIVKD